jgi:hypothetical protein
MVLCHHAVEHIIGFLEVGTLECELTELDEMFFNHLVSETRVGDDELVRTMYLT